ncbi:MAG TPA: MFS transporter, partial [Flavisolibacter sp.]|nr:MFS transporter [Flavisolibacter sp.]
GAFFLYGLYAAATEGIAKAWITNVADARHAATAIGFYTSCESSCALLASIVAGAAWTGFGSQAVFLSSSVVALGTAAYFLFLQKSKPIS